MANLAAKDRTRSPRFPSYALEESIGYARKIYDGVHRSSVDSDTAFRLMGFAGKSGASAKALGSMRQFGLIEGIGEKTRISDLALSILEPASSAERAKAILRAVHEPSVFRDISDRFDGKVPSVDEPVRAFLIRDLGFSKGGADDCIGAMRKSLAYSQTFDSESSSSSDVADAPPESETLIPQISVATTQPSAAPSIASVNELMRVRLSRDCIVELRFEGTVDSKALDYLARYIELQKEVWLEA